MNRKFWLLPLLFTASIAHSKGILVMYSEELNELQGVANMVPPDYLGTAVSRKINIEQMFDMREEINSPKNVRTLQKYIHEVDYDILLDGVVLVGDFPRPSPHFTDEPAYQEVTATMGDNGYRPNCGPSRNSALNTRTQTSRDTQATLARYRKVQEAVSQGSNPDVGLRDQLWPATWNWHK